MDFVKGSDYNKYSKYNNTYYYIIIVIILLIRKYNNYKPVKLNVIYF